MPKSRDTSSVARSGKQGDLEAARKAKRKTQLRQRREVASELFSKGYSIAEVSRGMRVSYNTARRYREWYEDQLAEEAMRDPRLLDDVLKNTLRALKELDEIRTAAWADYENAAFAGSRAHFLRITLSAQEQRAKLFNLFGVKAEYMAHVQRVAQVQQKLLTFLRDELCPEDRAKLEAVLAGILGESPMVLDAVSVEAS